MSGFQNLKK